MAFAVFCGHSGTGKTAYVTILLLLLFSFFENILRPRFRCVTRRDATVATF